MRELVQYSECFIVKGHMTHNKWYDYKYTYTTLYKTVNKQQQHTDMTKLRDRQTDRQTETERGKRMTDRERTKVSACAAGGSVGENTDRYCQN